MDGRHEAKIIALDAHRAAIRHEEHRFEIRILLQRMLALSTLAAERAHTDAMRATLQERLDQLGTEVDRLAPGTEFTMERLLDGGVAVGSTSQAQEAVARLQAALQTVSSQRAGPTPSGQNRIMGREMASELTRLSRSQIHHQPATALMAQARSLLGNMLRFPGRQSTR